MDEPVELAALERGAGPPVALVHGAVFHSGPAWARTIGPLTDAGYRVIAVDRRGHGRSLGTTGAAPVRLQAEDLHRTLERRAALPAHLVAVSYGSLVALELSLVRTEDVRSLLLLEPPLLAWLAGDPVHGPWVDRMRQAGLRGRAGAPLAAWVPEWVGLMDERMARRLTPSSPGWSMIERHARRVAAEEPAWEYRPDERRLRTLPVRALVVNGALSASPMQAMGRLLAERLPRGTHAVIEGGGHDAHAGRAEAFNRLLLDWLSEDGAC